MRAGDAVLVAVSAGADSAALAGLLARAGEAGLPLRLVLGHVDHGWRGAEEALADREAVTRLATALSLPVAFAGPPSPVRRTEDDARRFRYAALARLAREAGCAKVATGHHLRDQAETFLMRLLRGSGPAGLAGIPPRRPLHAHGEGAAGGPALEVVRPVLWVHPARLREYAVAAGLPFREDWTNACLDRDRARVRARLVALGEKETALSTRLAAAAERFRARLERRERDVAERLRASLAVHVEAEAVEVRVAALAALPRAWIASALRVLGAPLCADRDGPWFTRRHAELAADLVHGTGGGTGGTVPFPRRLDLHRFGARVVLARRTCAALPAVVLEGREGSAAAGRFRVTRREVHAARFDVERWRTAHAPIETPAPSSSWSWSAAFDADRLGERLEFRAAREDDAFVPLGRCDETSVLAFLGKQGVPEVLRRGARVAATPAGAAWVLGHRIDARYAVTTRTQRVAIVEARAE